MREWESRVRARGFVIQKGVSVIRNVSIVVYIARDKNERGNSLGIVIRSEVD